MLIWIVCCGSSTLNEFQLKHRIRKRMCTLKWCDAFMCPQQHIYTRSFNCHENGARHFDVSFQTIIANDGKYWLSSGNENWIEKLCGIKMQFKWNGYAGCYMLICFFFLHNGIESVLRPLIKLSFNLFVENDKWWMWI